MIISTELFAAILSMDAYNRGYAAGLSDGINVSNGVDVDGLGESGSIGTAQVVNPSKVGVSESVYQAWKDAGFYAVAYDWNGKTVISYRGTDNPSLAISRTNDILSGWSIGAGFTGSATQAGLALQFYDTATGHTVWDGQQSNVILTGHSLGGGLAGLVSSLSGTEGYGFDYMPFGIAAYAEKAYADNAGLNPNPVTFASFEGYYTSGEALAPVRNGAVQIASSAITGALGLANGITTAYLDSYVQKTALSPNAIARPDTLHSQALLVNLLYAAESGQTAWSSIGQKLFSAMFNENVGLAAGFKEANTDGTYSSASKMLAAIAYSALNSGSASSDSNYGYVFGNTGIKAMFDDADTLGALVTANKTPGSLAGAMEGLTQIVVEFAGLMANHKVNFHSYEGGPEGLFHPETGVVTLLNATGVNTSSDLAPKFYPVSSLLQRFWVAVF